MPNNDNDDDKKAAAAERIIEKGQCVFSHEWDNGGPGGGAGCEDVYCWRGRFAVSSADFGPAGPFDSLEEALEDRQLLLVNSATVSLSCSLLSSDELAKRIAMDPDVSGGVINEEEWAYNRQSGEWRRLR